MARVTAALVEDQLLLRLGIVQVLESSGITVVAEAEDGPTALQKVLATHPNVLLIKKDLPDADGVLVVQQIRKFARDQRVIMMLSKPSDLWPALESHANGYVLRETVVNLLPHAVEQVWNGKGWIGPNIAHYLLLGEGLSLLADIASHLKDVRSDYKLSLREQDVAQLIVRGMSNQQIADQLGLRLQTIKVHVKNVLRKLRVNSRSEVIAKLLRSKRTL